MTARVIARGTITCPADKRSAIVPAMKDHIRLSRAEPGCIQFDITASPSVPDTFVVTEEFANRAAFDAHTNRTRASDWWGISQHLPRQIIVQDVPATQDLPNWQPPPAPPPDLVLDGRFARLERLDAASHAAGLFAANRVDAAKRNWDYLPYGPFDRVDDYADWIDATCTAPDPHFFAIERKDTRQLAGIASYLRIAPASGVIEVGHINFSPLLQRSIAATEVMYLMMRWAFDAGYRRYEWKCNAANMRSRRAAERLGFSFEGVFRQHLIAKGKNRDTAWFATIDTEWPALKAAFETWIAADNFDTDGNQKLRLWDLTAPYRVTDDPARVS